ncbi:MAG: C40 family peptidase [Pacificimonas sp.]
MEARRFERPQPHRLDGLHAEMMRDAPIRSATAVSELLPGERFDVVDIAEGWAWGFSAHDHYVGYVDAANLVTDAPARTHRINAPTALCFSRPDIKSDVAHLLPMAAEIAAETYDDEFLRLGNGTFVHHRHAKAFDVREDDPVRVAQAFRGTPYRWGGRRRAGIDCSGLIQMALGACGVTAPRDSDMQAAELGQPLDIGPWENESLKRGDLVFFPGHVGIMVDADRLLHANAHWMTTLVEPLGDVVDRLTPAHAEPITTIRRL